MATELKTTVDAEMQSPMESPHPASELLKTITLNVVEITQAPPPKPLSFYMSMLMLGLMCIIIAWDATSLSIAVPVSSTDSSNISFG